MLTSAIRKSAFIRAKIKSPAIMRPKKTGRSIGLPSARSDAYPKLGLRFNHADTTREPAMNIQAKGTHVAPDGLPGRFRSVQKRKPMKSRQRKVGTINRQILSRNPLWCSYE